MIALVVQVVSHGGAAAGTSYAGTPTISTIAMTRCMWSQYWYFWFDWSAVTTGGSLTVTGGGLHGSTTSPPPTVVTLTGCGGVTCVITGTITTGSSSLL